MPYLRDSAQLKQKSHIGVISRSLSDPTMTGPTSIPMSIQTLESRHHHRYNERDFVARGSFGVIYKPRITEPGNFAGNDDVALKCVHLHMEARLLANTEIRQALHSRWEKIFDLEHSHLLAYYSASLVISTGTMSVEFVMDYYNEGDLAALLSSSKLREDPSRPFDQEAVICFALQLVDGLTFLHQNGIIHGDIKPENILVKSMDKKHRKLVIGDLDDCIQTKPDTGVLDMSLFHGTVRYMSPEMLDMWLTEATNEKVGFKTDLWSLGCVILTLANHSLGNAKMCLTKGTTVQTTETLMDHQYAELINEGWVPFVAESISVSEAACFQECVRTDHTYRISAEKLLENLRDTAEEISKLSSASEAVDQECFCSSA